jgi:hypothetical protein
MSSWTTVGALNTARDGYGIIPLSGTKALIIGGASNFPSFTATCEIFDHGTDTWSPTGSMSRANGEGMYATLNTGVILAVGGLEAGPTYSATCELYTPGAGTWATTGSLSTPRADHGAIWKLPSGKILVAGGTTTGGNPTATCEIYDPVAGTWSAAASLYTTITNMAFSTLGDGRPMWAGGWTGSTGSTLTARTYTYDEGSNTWTRQGDLPSVLACQNTRTAITLVNGNVFVFGGYTAVSTPQTVAYIYDQVANTWSSSSAAPSGLVESSLALLSTNQVLQYAVRFGTQTQTYNYTNDTWTSGPAVAGECSGQSYSNNGVVFSDGKILSAGGQNGSGNSVSTTQIFSGVASMGIAFVHKTDTAAGIDGPSHTFTITQATGTGNLLVVCLQNYLGTSPTTTSITDNAGNTYVQVASSLGSGNSVQSEIWYAANSIAGATSLTCNSSGTYHQLMVEFFEFSGAATTSPADTATFTTFAGSSGPTVGNITPSQTGEVLVSGACSGSFALTGISTSGWVSTAANTVESQCSGYLLNPTLTSQGATYTTGSTVDGTGSIAGFKAAPTGPSKKKIASMNLVF